MEEWVRKKKRPCFYTEPSLVDNSRVFNREKRSREIRRNGSLSVAVPVRIRRW